MGTEFNWDSAKETRRYEKIAAAIQAAIARGQYRPGERLPTVRALARQLNVSGTSVAVAYSMLARQGKVHTQVGRGTFVTTPDNGIASTTVDQGAVRNVPFRGISVSPASRAAGWRGRVIHLGDRLRMSCPEALVCASSWPDPQLLPVEALKRAHAQMARSVSVDDLEYAGSSIHPELIQALLPRLHTDGIPAEGRDLVVTSAGRQTLGLTLETAQMLLRTQQLVVATEEPGYHLALDLVENRGHQLVGVEMDAQGAIPGSLGAALDQGANLVLLTPRAVGPTGASWTTERRDALADVLALYPDALILEDDHFAGLTQAPCGSLLGDPRLEDRVIYSRTFSKSIAPDLRLGVALARPRLRSCLQDAKLLADGWSSRVTQRLVAAVLEDPDIDHAFVAARTSYAERRRAAAEAITSALPGANVVPGMDGLNVWVPLPEGCDSLDVIHNAAQEGVVVASGEAFFIHPGRRDAVRLSVGWVDREDAYRAGRLLASAVSSAAYASTSMMV